MTSLSFQLAKTLSVMGVVFSLASLGCSGKPSVVKTELVEGVVTLDGQPVPGATITFTPVQDGAGAPATGLSDETGKYTLTAAGLGGGKVAEAGAGTLPGEYYVGVRKDEMPVTPGSTEPGYQMPADTKQPPAPPEVKHIVPIQFNDPQKSGIKKTVKSGKNDIPIELKSS